MLWSGKQQKISSIDYSRFHKLLALGGAMCAVLITVFVLFYPPMPGVADQGDFQRVMSAAGLSELSADSTHWFRYVTTQYRMTSLNKEGSAGRAPVTSMIYPIEAAREISKLTRSQYFSTKNLAVVYAVFYILSIYMCLRYIRFKRIITSICFTLLSLLILLDGNYLVWFNSLYGEPMMITSLLFFSANVLYVSLNISKFNFISMLLLFVSAYLFLGAKLQCFSALPLIVLLIIRIVLLSNRKVNTEKTVNSFVVFVFILILISFVKGIYNQVNSTCGVDTMYNSVFYGVLRESKDPEKDLQALGLSQDMAVDAGKHAYLPKEQYIKYVPSSRLTKLELNEKMNNFKLLKFYLSRPDRLLKGMEYTASKCFNTMGSLGKYEKSEVKEYTYIFKRFTLWSNFRSSVLPKSLIFIVPYYLIVFTVTIMEYRRNKTSEVLKLRIELIWTIMMVGLLQFPMPFIGNGEADTGKQLFLFNYTFDITFLCSATWAFDRICNHVLNKKG